MSKSFVINLPSTNYFLKVHSEPKRGDSYSWCHGVKYTTHFSSRDLAEKAIAASGIEGLEIVGVSNGDAA